MCSVGEVTTIYYRLSAILERDPNAGSGGKYLIKSVYFDDYDNNGYHDKESGTDPRGKWRIRAYNNDDSLINLEYKYKEHGMISKDSCSINREQYEKIMSGSAEIADVDNPVYRRFMIACMNYNMKPAVIVQYMRVPFVCRDGNVRVTIDTNIGSSTDFDNFFNEDMPVRMIMPQVSELVEVKYDEFLPDYIYHAVQLSNMKQESFSKYCLCRKFTIGGYV